MFIEVKFFKIKRSTSPLNANLQLCCQFLLRVVHQSLPQHQSSNPRVCSLCRNLGSFPLGGEKKMKHLISYSGYRDVKYTLS